MPLGKSSLFNRHDLVAIAMLGGSAMMAGSQIQEGRIASAQGKAEEKIAKFNAVQKEREARSRMEAASIQEERVAKQEKIVKAEQRAAFAKSGITLEGSPLGLLAETAGEFARERALTLREGMIQSGQLKSEASILRAGGKLSAQLGKAQRTASFIKAGGTMLSAFGTVGKLNKAPLGPNVNPQYPGTAFRTGVSGPIINR